MDLGAIGPGSAGMSLLRVEGSNSAAVLAKVLLEAGTETLGDSVATLLSDLSAADIAKLIDVLERPLPALETAHLEELLQAFSSAASGGDATRALSALSKIVVLDPSRAETLRTDPAIAPIRTVVDQFLDRHTLLAKLDTEGHLAQAAQQTDTGAPEKLIGWDMKPATMVLIANRLFDSGGLANYVRAGEVAQLVVEGLPWVPGGVSLTPAPLELAPIKSRDAVLQPIGKAPRAEWQAGAKIAIRLGDLWVRAPLLILLLAWLLLGVMGGVWSLLWLRFRPETWPASLVAIAFEIWGTGFLTLVAFGFYARVRKVRR